MHPRAPKLLEDIRSAADFVKTATQGVPLEQFKLDRLLRQAVERNFEIIGCSRWVGAERSSSKSGG